jgi:hypothetical protein
MIAESATEAEIEAALSRIEGEVIRVFEFRAQAPGNA